MTQAYQQLPVDEETAEAQTIVTHRGAFKCNRLQFGVCIAPGLFQSIMERLLQGIPGCVPYFDDVLVSGETQEQLFKRLTAVLTRIRDAGLRLKEKKCHINVPKVEFLGFLVDGSGIHPTDEKIRAIRDAPTPRTQTELQAFLGLLNFYSVFLKQKATVAEPLHRLLTKHATWVWGREQESAFQAVKGLLTGDSLLVQYSPTLPLILVCDASPFGVGAVLSHRLPNGSEAPIAFYSRTLSSAERNYSQLDKEALAAVAGVKRFHEYLYGREFTLVTDHKPLLGLLAGNRPTPASLSPRMTRWTVFLAAYSYHLIHRPGATVGHADGLSRCPLPALVEDPVPEALTLLMDVSDSSPVTSGEIALATAKDSELTKVMSCVLRGWPKSVPGELHAFAVKKQELSVLRGCLLWGERVVVPTKLREEILTTLHVGHPGIVKMKALARSYVWWPNVDKDITEWVATCQPCQESRPAPAEAPAKEWERPQAPWSRVHIDFAGPFHGLTFLIVVDAYSKWLEVVRMGATTAEATILALRRIFATHGLPDVLVSDNGPQFTSLRFESWLANCGTRHALTAPFRPQGNGQAERFVRSAKEALARMSPDDWQTRIDTYLFSQHTTPSAATGKSPAELLMGRRLRTVLDRLHPNYSAEKPLDSSSKIRELNIGDEVYAHNYSEGALWVPGKVTGISGPRSYLVELEDGRSWRRHIDQLRGRLSRLHLRAPDIRSYDEDDSNQPERNSPPQIVSAEKPTHDSGPQQGEAPVTQEPEQQSQQRPLAVPEGEPEERSAPAEIRTPTKPRRSSRVPRKPAYLKDYITR